MGIKERKKRERERRKDQILTAAIELIEKQGFEKTTMDEIAEQAELSKGTLYLYFNDKSSLHQSIKRRSLQHLHDKFQQIIQLDFTGAELVKKMLLTFIKVITQNAAFMISIAIYEHLNSEKHTEDSIVRECHAIEDEIFMLLVRAIQIGIQDGSITTSKPPKILALNLSFQMSGMLQFYLSGSHKNAHKTLQDNNLTIPEMMEQFLDTFLNEHV
jgi:AcrR family transcriptional regulator